MSLVFISYRRSDSSDVTGRIYDRLSAHFGQDEIFKDVDSIPLAVDFREEIDSKIRKAKVVLVIIGSTWLEILNSRLNDPNDWVRIELETALLYRIPILPVLVSGASMPDSSALPISIRSFTNQNAAKARPDPDFHVDIDRLINGLERRFDLPSSVTHKSQVRSDKIPKVPQIWLHGWSRYRADNGTADFNLDWNAHYDKSSSTYPTLGKWDSKLAPDLMKLKRSVDEAFSSQIIEFRNTLPLAPVVAVGHVFQQTSHYKLKIKQGEEIWQSYGLSRSTLRFEIKEAQGKPGSNLAIGFGITGDAWPMMQKLMQAPVFPLDATVYLQIPEPGSVAIDNADAIALAVQAKDMIRNYKHEYNADCIHLIIFAPAAYALFLGHYLNRLGEIIVYEFISDRYQPVVRINT
ncbi:SAVED domain-containing protein [Almyronema epifaneia]|uniref:SAVED domain-containing protein n=1 Tax=Almyronema epifaneia S1 TaxID=2991925 RepID=A0ABW6IKA7_9CYAN